MIRSTAVMVGLSIVACAGEAPPESRPPAVSVRGDDGAPAEEGETQHMSEADVARHAVWTPKPDGARIAAAIAGAASVSAYNETGFCVRTNGTTWNIRTLHSTGVAEADAIFRETIAAWRFRSFRIDGELRCVCTEIRFNLKFK